MPNSEKRIIVTGRDLCYTFDASEPLVGFHGTETNANGVAYLRKLLPTCVQSIDEVTAVRRLSIDVRFGRCFEDELESDLKKVVDAIAACLNWKADEFELDDRTDLVGLR